MPRYLIIHLGSYPHSQLSETVHGAPTAEECNDQDLRELAVANGVEVPQNEDGSLARGHLLEVLVRYGLVDSMPTERVATSVLAMEVEADDSDEAMQEAAPAFGHYGPLSNLAAYEIADTDPVVRFAHSGDSVFLRDPAPADDDE